MNENKSESKESRKNDERAKKKSKVEYDQFRDESAPSIKLFRSKNFEIFYQIQQLMNVDEWSTFMSKLRDPLPAAFRFNQNCGFKDQILDEFRESIKKLSPENERNFLVPLKWFPGGNAFKLGYGRKDIKKNKNLKEIQKCMIKYTDLGYITRQEEPGNIILDMCAAPGSKTNQILDQLSGSGLVIANDSKLQRAFLLTHQCQRTPSVNLCVTCCDGRRFPTLGSDSALQRGKKPAPFDRILCDVPCTGDGTVRKSPNIWKIWSLKDPIALHRLQICIALRACALLKPGGRMVYSTCSLCPYENEAVVAELLRKNPDDMELLDVSSEFCGLLRRPGLKSWKVMYEKTASRNEFIPEDQRTAENIGSVFPKRPNGEYLDEIELTELAMKQGIEVVASYKDVPKEKQNSIVESLFPPSKEESRKFNLNYCLRFLPQDQDTGCFFVAVLQKNTDFESELEVNKEVPDALLQSSSSHRAPLQEGEKSDPEAKKDKNKTKTGKEKSKTQNREILVPFDSESIEAIREYYGLDAAFPSNRLYVKSKGEKVVASKIEVVSSGVRVLERFRSKDDKSIVRYRLCYEGLSLFLPYMTKRLHEISVSDFSLFLSKRVLIASALSVETQNKIESEQGSLALYMTTKAGMKKAIPVLKDKACTVYVKRDYLDALVSELTLLGEYVPPTADSGADIAKLDENENSMETTEAT